MQHFIKSPKNIMIKFIINLNLIEIVQDAVTGVGKKRSVSIISNSAFYP